MKNVTDIFIKIARIDSPSGHETAMKCFLQTWLGSRGYTVKEDSVGNVYAKNNKVGTPLLLCAHMDTVEPGRGIKPVVKNGKITSDNNTILGADNKAAIASLLVALESVGAKRPLEILFTVREETGGGIEFFPFRWITAKQGLVFDSSNPLGGIVLRSPQITNFNVVLKGKPSHSSLPEIGKNVFVPAFAALSKIKVGSKDKGETTANIGLIQGGTGVNTVPAFVSVKGEVRSYSPALFTKSLSEIRRYFSKQAIKSGVKMNFSTEGFCPGYSHRTDDVFIVKIVRLLESIGLPVVFYTYSGVSDANILNKRGIRTVNLCDGTKFTHTVAEEITVNDLKRLSLIVESCIVNL